MITGKSATPVYLWVHDGKAELRDAAHLWGQTTGDAQRLIQEELGDPKIEVAQCGIAGERGVRYAAIMNMSNRAHGRTGMGAVMGSKNLKAIAVRGHGKINVADKTTIAKLARKGAKSIPEYLDVEALQKYGTAGVVMYQDTTGGLPTRNYTSGTFEQAIDICGETMADTILVENDTCYACSVRCKRVVETEYQGRDVVGFYGGAEYESLATLGSYCMVGDLDAVSLANQLCAEYGVDTIACGATIAWAMECFERGILSLEDTGGIELRFGNADAMLKLVEQIAHREGLGRLLGEGSALAAQAIGKGSEDYVVAVKAGELPAHMPQVKRSLALIYAVNPFGADHQSHEHDPGYTPDAAAESLARLARLGLTDPQPNDALNPAKVEYAMRTQWNYSFMDTADLCQFVYGPSWQLFGPDDMVALMRAATGWDFTIEEMQRVGERRLNLMRAFNAREGAGRDQDTLPKRIFDDPLVGGASDGVAVTREELAAALDDYYELCGWDIATGNPTPAKLQELDLGWLG